MKELNLSAQYMMSLKGTDVQMYLLNIQQEVKDLQDAEKKLKEEQLVVQQRIKIFMALADSIFKSHLIEDGDEEEHY